MKFVIQACIGMIFIQIGMFLGRVAEKTVGKGFLAATIVALVITWLIYKYDSRKNNIVQ